MIGKLISYFFLSFALFHEILEKLFGWKIGPISLVDFSAYLVAIQLILVVLEKLFGWKLGGAKFFRMIGHAFTFPMRVSRYMKSMTLNIDKIMAELTIPEGGTVRGELMNTKQTVNELYKQNRKITGRQLALYNSSPTPMFITGPTGGVNFVNSAWLKMVGKTIKEEVYGLGWINVIPPEDRQQMLAVNESMKKDAQSTSGEVRFLHATNNKIITCDYWTETSNDEKGNLLETIGYLSIKKITDR